MPRQFGIGGLAGAWKKDPMVVRIAILALLSGLPCHAYSLHRRLARHFTPFRGLALAQVRMTLRRLETAHLVQAAPPDESSRILFHLTDRGQTTLDCWLREGGRRHRPPDERIARLAILDQRANSELFLGAITWERTRLLHRLRRLESPEDPLASRADSATSILVELAKREVKVDLRWLDSLATTTNSSQ